MKRSEQFSNISNALMKFQKEVKPIPKSADNPFFHSKYADLSTIMELIKIPLDNSGLLVIQSLSTEANIVTVLTTVIHTTGEWVETEVKLPSKELTPQGFGSAITYGRRYGLSALLFLATEEDDDGNASSKNDAVNSSKTPDTTKKTDTTYKPVNTTEKASVKQVEYIDKMLGFWKDGSMKEKILSMQKVSETKDILKCNASSVIKHLEMLIAKAKNVAQAEQKAETKEPPEGML